MPESSPGDSGKTSAVGSWREQFRAHSYDVDFTQRLTLEAICRYFQEVAWIHADALGVGYAKLAEQNKVWVLSRLRIELSRSPHWGEDLVIETWPRTARGLFAMRDFELIDSSSGHCAAGTSAWLVLDATTRRPQRIEKLVSAFRSFPEKRAIQCEPEKLDRPVQSIVTTDESLPHNAESSVRYSDLDVNCHLNGARYVGLLLDAYTLDFHQRHTPALLEINYLAESRFEETLAVSSLETSPCDFRHSLVKKGTQEEVCRARLLWLENPTSSREAAAG